ncbi:MAG: hypothetical protein QGI51_00280 [Dehalococcoidales bacterium]|jgi:hypothetical protein|nr:hypothetical protein [Dehalococcoidales bacterium]MDP6127779.1 hypothetical protein [Dehalococcoidales bacterium]MDP6631926.1 hypothetical protein [Dehalococcoidales bacterium]MDP7525770.1 hypothetical protein [Dehalococcoidales bacterium]|tara:strand:- start:251 stop:988 length:738 start_codon:yes stop_codon:yes gene_type:complete
MFFLRTLRTIVTWGWYPILITALALVGIRYEWEFWVIASVLSAILVIGLVMVVIRASERRLELVSMRLKRLAGYFSRRFTGTSSLSIFTIIDTLFNLDDPQLWDWARACDMSARLFNTWCDSFVDRIESDARTGRFPIYLRTYLDELWLLNNHYFEFVEQFYEIGEKVDIPPATRDQYNRFAVEYNSFAQNFRDHIAELGKVAGTEIEPPSVKLARELSAIMPIQTIKEEEISPPQPPDRRGHYM